MVPPDALEDDALEEEDALEEDEDTLEDRRLARFFFLGWCLCLVSTGVAFWLASNSATAAHV